MKIKKFISIVLCLIMAMSAFYAYAEEEENLIIDDSWCICSKDEKLKTVSDTLSDYVRNVCSVQLPVLSEKQNEHNIVLTTDDSLDGGYVISSDEADVYISGSTLQQTVRGVYAFLEKFAGVRSYTSEKITYTKDTVSVPVNVNIEYVPPFEFTDTDWLSPNDVQYSLFNGLNSAEYRDIPEELGGCVDYIPTLAHTLSTKFCSAEKYYDEHPEYFASYRGFRTKNQLCLSNPDVLRIVTDEVLELLAKEHDEKADLQIVTLTQNDNITFCTCPECRKIDNKYGSHAGTMLEFCNAVAKQVKKAGYDNVAIDTFAYRYTRKPPKGIVPDDNVIIRLCSIECCFSHAFDDESCKTNKAFMDDLRGWSEICDRIYIWDYCTNYCNWTGLFPDFGVLQRNMQVFKENNVKGIYEEGNYSMKAEAEFGELRAWLIGQLFKDPYLDYDAAVSEFCNAYYGEGGKYIKEFLDLITENESKMHLGIYQSMKDTLNLSSEQIGYCDSLWAKAKEASSDDELDHVLGSEISWRWWKMKNRVSEFKKLSSFGILKDELMKDISDRGIEKTAEMDSTHVFFNQLLQGLYYKVYSLVNFVLKILYA